MDNRTYSQKLRDPRWYAKRQEILERDKHRCRYCQTGDEPEDGWEELELQVHHLRYFKGKEPWDYDNEFLISLCDTCHGNVTDDLGQIADLLVQIQQVCPWELQGTKGPLKRFLFEVQTRKMPDFLKEATANDYFYGG